MEFSNTSFNKARRGLVNGYRKIIKIEKQFDENSHNLNMYSHPLSESISFIEFQKLGQKRLTVLRKLEAIKERYGSNKDEYKHEYMKEIGALMPIATLNCPSNKISEARRDDVISHFILRLAFCQRTDQTEWFIKQETELFRMRFQLESMASIISFLAMNNFELEQLSQNDKSTIISELANAYAISPESVLKSDFFMVNFEEVFELLLNFKVFLRHGIAYITPNELIALFAPRFRNNLVSSMGYARRHLGAIQEEERLIPLLKQFVNKPQYMDDYAKNQNSSYISSEMVASYANKSFPLCMRRIHYTLQNDHHLRHFARLQFGLFLQGIGMSMESALDYFRQGFSPNYSTDQFDKKYAYNIRHIYGKEGKRQIKKPMSCASIILGNAPLGTQDCHGCPFKHLESKDLEAKLNSLGLNGDQVYKINNYARNNRYDKACTLFFEYEHKMKEDTIESIITHPNQYFTFSRDRLIGESDNKEIK